MTPGGRRRQSPTSSVRLAYDRLMAKLVGSPRADPRSFCCMPAFPRGACGTRSGEARKEPSRRAGLAGFRRHVACVGSLQLCERCARHQAALGIAGAMLMGRSFGGSVAIPIAVEQPNRVRRLALVDSGLLGYDETNPPEAEQLIRRVEAAFRREEGEQALALLEQIWLVGPSRSRQEVDDGYLRRARELLRKADRPDNGAVHRDSGWSAGRRFEHLQMPVLVVVGSEGVPSVVSAGYEMGRRLRSAPQRWSPAPPTCPTSSGRSCSTRFSATGLR